MSTTLASNSIKPVELPSTHNAAYERILKLRDDVFADRHPTLKPLKQVPPATKLPVSVSSLSGPAIKDGIFSSTVKAPAHNVVSGKSAQAGVATAATSDTTPTTSSGPASGIDPIFLTKSDVLVRAELQQKRQRLERSLDEQIGQKRAFARQNVLEEYALPEFNVMEVLRKAQNIVKPIRLTVRNAANRVASSSDSFDEKTFYSSQMNTTSEETDAPANHMAHVEAQEGGPQPMDIDSGNDADEQISSRSQGRIEPVTAKAPESHVEQIARLEKELRLLRSTEKPTQRPVTPPITREAEILDEPPYSPPDVRVPSSLVSGTNNVSADDVNRARPLGSAPRRSSKALESQSREYARRNDMAEELATSDMRIVRNHITSPLAPQPARVSPLAVAKGPAVSQIRNNRQQNKRSEPAIGNSAGRHSPNQPVQPLSSRKRRRRTNSGETGRNVAARKEVSPEVRIKDEPVSPQPPGALEAWRPPRKEEVHRPVYIDTTTPRQRPVEQSNTSARRNEDHGPSYLPGSAGPMTPAGHGGGRIIEIPPDSDMRPVLSAKQVRAPPSPVEKYSGANPYSMQAVSQVYLPRASQDPSQQYRASAQLLPRYGPDRSPSPALLHVQRSPPPRHGSVVMAPPPRRIVVDQYGNRFIEAPVPPERQMSIVPLGRSNDYDSRYEPIRATSVRNPSFEHPPETRYLQRAPSPASPRYIEYAPPARTRSMVPENDRYRESAYPPPSEGVRIVRYPENQIGRFEEVARPSEAASRMPSVRPMGNHYEMPREPITRVQSVRPERERIIDLSGRREAMAQPVRQVSVRPEEMYMRQPGPAEERPRYQYAPETERRYFTDGAYDERVVFESARDPMRRVVS
ncbi:MAG: hypothetical protein Q9191_003275 [Dirinaria sp. TL-2023a]